MSLHPMYFAGLPTAPELNSAPERAILAALDANLVLAARVIEAEHPQLDEPDQVATEPVLQLARSILTSAASLHELIAGYSDLIDRIARRDRTYACQKLVPLSFDSIPDNDDDIPF